MDQSELEDGEITDSGDENEEISANCAVSISNSITSTEDALPPRPTNPAMSYRVPQEALPSVHPFRDSPGEHDDSDCDSDDSSKDPLSAKRPKVDPEKVAAAKPKKRNVWADVILEQQISSSIKSAGNIEGDDLDTIERGVESYRPSGDSRTAATPLETADPLEQGELWDVNADGESVDTAKIRISKKKKHKHKHKHKRTVKDRLDYEEFTEDGFENYELLDELPDAIYAEDDERLIARYIARKLCEPKVVLIERVTRFVGKEKTLSLFKHTLEIEDQGGMMTLSGGTRRTPGGVFIQLLKKDKEISKDTVKEIFAVERENQKFAKKVFIKEKQIRKRKYYTKPEEGAGQEMESKVAMLEEDFEQMEEPDIEIGVAS